MECNWNTKETVAWALIPGSPGQNFATLQLHAAEKPILQSPPLFAEPTTVCRTQRSTAGWGGSRRGNHPLLGSLPCLPNGFCQAILVDELLPSSTLSVALAPHDGKAFRALLPVPSWASALQLQVCQTDACWRPQPCAQCIFLSGKTVLETEHYLTVGGQFIAKQLSGSPSGTLQKQASAFCRLWEWGAAPTTVSGRQRLQKTVCAEAPVCDFPPSTI